MLSNTFVTPLGLMTIVHQNDVVYELKFTNDYNHITYNDLTNNILNYYNTLDLNINYKLVRTPFQLLVWNEICKIPKRQTRTYGEIATLIGKSKSYRAVARACGQNKLSLIVPCHRVVGKNNIGGYEWGVDIKKWLLDFEKQ